MNWMKHKNIFYWIVGLFIFIGWADLVWGQELKVGDIAPSWALMYSPGKYEMLSIYSAEPGEKLKRPVSQPYRHAVVMSFFATWCQPCMKELPILEKVYNKYKNERVKFFLIDITEATRNMTGFENSPKAGPFLKKKGVTMPILYDTRGVAMERYGAQTLPRLYIVNGNRKITLIREGFHPGKEKEFTTEISGEIEKLLKEL